MLKKVSYSLLFDFLEHPRRTEVAPGYPVKFPFLEDCRLLKQQFRDSIMRNEYVLYKDGTFSFAWFNETGSLEYWSLRPKWLITERLCRDLGVYGAHVLLEVPPSNATLKSCDQLETLLYSTMKSQQMTDGTCDVGNTRFCFEDIETPHYPYPENPPFEYASYKIRPRYFYEKDKDGKLSYKSPTIAEYQRLLKKKSDYIDDGFPDSDYLYDYW